MSDPVKAYIQIQESLLDQLGHHVPACAVMNIGISKWSVGQQIEHVLKSVSAVLWGLQHTDPHVGEREPNKYREYIHEHGSFPRGVVQAPKEAYPAANPDLKSLDRLILKTRRRVLSVQDTPVERTIEHPIMGTMTRDECLDFLIIHTRHHLAIIDDILNSGVN